MTGKISTEHLERGAIVYVRQSTMHQVRTHDEGRRRQYELVERARELGFSSIEVIDDDLGCSGSGLQARPGFQRLVSMVCAVQTGAVFCLEASRLARNGRDWHHLLDLCALVGVLLFDPDGVYDPRLMNDRLLLGLKGTMSEYELSLLRQRSIEARDAKAGRGELRCGLPPGYVWVGNGKMDKDPDLRIAEGIGLVFSKFDDFGSVRQTWLWFRIQELSLPVMRRSEEGIKVEWKKPSYHNLLSILRNPLYAGAYAFGRTGQRTSVVDGRARRTNGHRKPIEQWNVLIRDHHEGYIEWEKFLHNQAIIVDNAHMKNRASRKSGRGGRALLSGMVRCARCGCLMRVFYGSCAGNAHRYICRSRDLKDADHPCIGVGGIRVDQAVVLQLLESVTPRAVEAAEAASNHIRKQFYDARNAVAKELEEASYEARLAARRYEAVDPDKRLVAQELEARWEAALRRVALLEHRLSEMTASPPDEQKQPDIEKLRTLARQLPEIWNAASTDMKLKQRITRILIQEVILDVNEEKSEAIVVIHWTGGRHTEIRIPRNRAPLRMAHQPNAVEVVQKMAGRFTDREIAITLNRARRGRREPEAAWTEVRIKELREHLDLPVFDPSLMPEDVVSRDEAALRLGVCVGSVKMLIKRQVLPAEQIVPYAPWWIPISALNDEKVLEEVREIIKRRPQNLTKYRERKTLALPGVN
jgi:DNA invertase Pin-like site-specific DNA recombinase